MTDLRLVGGTDMDDKEPFDLADIEALITETARLMVSRLPDVVIRELSNGKGQKDAIEIKAEGNIRWRWNWFKSGPVKVFKIHVTVNDIPAVGGIITLDNMRRMVSDYCAHKGRPTIN